LYVHVAPLACGAVHVLVDASHHEPSLHGPVHAMPSVGATTHVWVVGSHGKNGEHS
jgi:hypothetical protein